MKESLRSVLSFFVNGSIHVALAVTSLSMITVISFEIPLDKDLLLFIFFGAIGGYNFIKYGGFGKLHHSKLAKNMKMILLFSFISLLALLYFALQLSFWVLLWSGLFALLTLLYALPVFGRQRNLRTVGGIKVFVIAGIWSGVSVLLPFVNAGLPIMPDVGVLLFQRFVFVLVLLLPFEIRDLKYDRVELKTIPQQIGIMKTKGIGIVLLFIFILAEMLLDKGEGAFQSAVLIALITSAMLLGAGRNQSRYYSSFWVEGIPVLWLLVLLVFRNLFFGYPPFVS